MQLPNADRAVVDIRKVTEYCLNEGHADGGDKAEGFRRVLGITIADAGEFRLLLLSTAQSPDAEPWKVDRFGESFTVDAMISWRGRSAVVTTGWIVRFGEDFPRLTTAYVSGPQRGVASASEIV